MSSDILQEILIEFIEVWLHNVIYRANLYPSQIFRSRYKYNVSVKQSTFPPLNNYIRTLVLSLQPQLRQQAIHSLTVNISLELKIQESFALTVSYPDEIDSQSDNEPPEKVLSSCKDSFRGHIVSVLNSDSKQDSELSEKRTFSVSVKTSELAGCQMSGWCDESVAELDVASLVVQPLLFTDVGLVRVQSTHRI
ncbi:mitotic spindle assembly checkpoint protein MAD2B-like [Bolinopsis microptera]|uniref:mitotic spindle assembly checkpoint protein MAD2B-like n=1 Tax=Bolinopsis microptera TaxID=2820187 RepID=UPI00307A5FC8